MKRTVYYFTSIGVIAVILAFSFLRESEKTEDKATYQKFSEFKKAKRKGDTGRKPTDWFTLSRAYPYKEIPFDAYTRALQKAVALKNESARLDNGIWTLAGPSNVGGRITALAVNPTDNDIIYAGAAAGGVFKSLDGGTTWSPISDGVPSLSVGDLAMDPNDPNRLFLGTGEANASGDSYDGTGIYRTSDGGNIWSFSGLPNSRHIGRIVFDPDNSQRIFVAAAGALFGTNPDRGIYRSIDGGNTWARVLYITDSTSAIDVAINPSNPNVLYAAMWERIRRPEDRRVGGLTSGIWKTTDGGDTWNRLTTGLPPQSVNNGRIGLAISPSNPEIIYASFTNNPGNLMGIWRTTNGGANWSSRLISPDPSSFSGFGWYFGQIKVHPTNSNTVYFDDVELWKSTDGGARWSSIIGSMHVDFHALYQDAINPNFMVSGNDGGVFTSSNGGSSWRKCLDLPITQFYAITIDQLTPHRLYGGTQDNSTPRTVDGLVDNWDVIFYGDGFYSAVDFTNSNIIFAEAQYGYLGKSTDLGNNFNIVLNGINSSERANWCTPVVMSPFNSRILFYGAQRVYRTTNGASSWTAISPDLTGGPGPGNLIFGTITTISQSPVSANVIWAGTDDARVWVTTNGGTNWTMVSDSLPDRWCTRVTADVFDIATAYVTFSGYKSDELLPHIFKTTNNGASWQNISGNLVDIPVNDILPDPSRPGRLFIGSDFGVYYSENYGTLWEPLGMNMSLCPVFDIDLHNDTRKLVSGTHGRSMYAYDLTQLDIVGCQYVIGDVNGNGSFNGLDVTYSVSYLKGGPVPPDSCNCGSHGMIYPSADVNGSCSVNGLDVTYMVNYFRGGADPTFCPDCPPLRRR